MGSIDEKVQEKHVVRGSTSDGGYQRVAGQAQKNNNTKPNFVLGKETGEYKTVSQNYYKWIQPMPDK